MNNVAEGIIAEYQAAEMLQQKGYTIIEKNVNFPQIGEIDIVALQGKTLVIVEVKYRANKEYGHPLESITKSKVRKIIKATEMYISQCKTYFEDIRFDVVISMDGNLEHIENAFYGNWA